MSMQVPVEELPANAAQYRPAVYVLVGAGDGPPRVTHSSIRWDGIDALVAVGRRSAAAVKVNPAVALLWPATLDQSMSLIADGEVIGDVDDDGGELRIRCTGAVRHRTAPPVEDD